MLNLISQLMGRTDGTREYCKAALLASVVLMATTVACPRSGLAAVWTWDASGNGSTFDGPGTWDTASNWWDGAMDQVWASGNDAVFGAGISAAGTVNLTAPTAVGNLTFNAPGSGSYNITGSALQLGNGSNVVNVNQNAEIDSPLTGGQAGGLSSSAETAH